MFNFLPGLAVLKKCEIIHQIEMGDFNTEYFTCSRQYDQEMSLSETNHKEETSTPRHSKSTTVKPVLSVT